MVTSRWTPGLRATEAPGRAECSVVVGSEREQVSGRRGMLSTVWLPDSTPRPPYSWSSLCSGEYACMGPAHRDDKSTRVVECEAFTLEIQF